MLDIIIPAYNTKNFLERCLKTTIFPDVTVTVIDDGSKDDYTDILKKYPTVNYYKQTNQGPGAARQNGLEKTHEPYIMFLDSDDYLITKNLSKALKEIQNNPDVKYHIFQYIEGINTNRVITDTNIVIHGKIYQRTFLEKYNIHFANTYFAEDHGFNNACNIILDYLNNTKDKMIHNFPICQYCIRNDSAIHNNNKEYLNIQDLQTFDINYRHAITICENAGIPQSFIAPYVYRWFCFFYYKFLLKSIQRPQYIQQNWNSLRSFYFNALKIYEPLNQPLFLKTYMDYYWKRLVIFHLPITQHLGAVLKQLETEEQVPSIYKHD